MLELTEFGYYPVNIGKMHWKNSTICYGLAYDHNRTLIALSAQGPNTQVEELHYALQSQETNTGVVTRHNEDEFDRFFYSRSSHFKVLKTPIPDTGEVSLIMLNDYLFRAQHDQQYTYLKAPTIERFKEELYHRVKSLVFASVLPEWKDFLYEEGIKRQDSARRLLCGILPNRRDTKKWMCAGFSLGYCTVDPQPWTELISEGLRRQRIFFPEDQNGSGKPKEQLEMKPNTAILFRTDGSQEVVVPENGTDFELHELYVLLDVHMIEVTRLSYDNDDTDMILVGDEEGKMVDNWMDNINPAATAIFAAAYGNTDVMVGNFLYCKSSMVR